MDLLGLFQDKDFLIQLIPPIIVAFIVFLARHSLFNLMNGWKRQRLIRRCEKDYLSALNNKYGYVIPRGLPAAEAGGIPLEELYVPLKLRSGGVGRFRHEGRDSIGVQVDERLSLETMLSRAESQGAAIIGGPGSGKTTVVSYLALMLGRYRQTKNGLRRFGVSFFRRDISEAWGNSRGKLPIIVQLRKLNDSVESLSDRSLLKISMGSPLADRCPEDMFKGFLDRGECVVLFDGLDEVSSDRKHEIIDNIKDFVALYGSKGNRCLLTCREAVFAGIGGFSVYSLCEFEREDVERYARAWYRAALSLHDPRKVDKFRRQSVIENNTQRLINGVWDNELARRLAVNPLLLSMLAVMYHPERKLPEGRVEFYGECLSDLLGKIDRVKGVINSFSSTQKLTVLEPLAYWMHRQPGGEADKKDILNRIRQNLPTLGEDGSLKTADAFLAETKERSGVLVDLGGRKYGFSHRTFLEYLAAREFRNRKDEGFKELLRLVNEPKWDSVCLFYVGLEVNPDAIRFVDVIRRRRSDPLRTNLFLAAHCLEEMVVVKDPVVEKGVIQDLVREVENGQFEGLKDKARRTLMRMGRSQRSKPVIEGISEMLHHSALRQEAAFMLIKLRCIDEEVVKAVLEMLCSEDHTQRDKAHNVLSEIAHSADSYRSVRGFLLNPEARYRGSAALAFGWLGIHDEVVIREIVALLEDPDQSVRERCAAALGWIGNATDDVVSALVKRLTLPDRARDVRYIAAAALGELGDRRDEVVEALVATVRDHDARVVGRAASSLGWLGDKRSEVLNALLGLLDSEEEDVRGRAVLALGDLGVSQEAITMPVARLLGDSEFPEVQWRAASALAQVGCSSKEVVTALSARVRSRSTAALSGTSHKSDRRQEDLVNKYASQALAWLNQGSGDVFNILKEVAENATGGQLADAVAAIGRLGVEDPHMVEFLVGRMEDPEEQEDVRGAAVSALRRLGVVNSRILAAIRGRLESDPAASVQWRAAMALGVFGYDDQDIIEILVSKLKNGEPEVKLRSADALVRLGKGGATATDAMVSLLFDEDPRVALHAIKALIVLGERGESIRGELLRAFRNVAGAELKGEIATSFGTLKCTEPPVIEELVRALSDADRTLRGKCASSLGELVRRENRVVKTIAELLDTEDPVVRRNAVMALYVVLRVTQIGIQEMLSTTELDLLDSLLRDNTEIGHPLVGARSRLKDVAWWLLREYQRSNPVEYKKRYLSPMVH